MTTAPAGSLPMHAGLGHSGEQVDVRRSAWDEFVDVDDLMVVGLNETDGRLDTVTLFACKTTVESAEI